jgi:hypothetical protein
MREHQPILPEKTVVEQLTEGGTLVVKRPTLERVVRAALSLLQFLENKGIESPALLVSLMLNAVLLGILAHAASRPVYVLQPAPAAPPAQVAAAAAPLPTQPVPRQLAPRPQLSVMAGALGSPKVPPKLAPPRRPMETKAERDARIGDGLATIDWSENAAKP